MYPTENQGSSSVEEITYQSGGCWLGAGEISTKWFYFTALTTGTIEITFDGPGGQDYDFAVWGPSTNGEPECPTNTGDSPIRCSYSAAANPVGIGNGATDLYEDATGDGWVAPLDVIAGETYVLALNIFQNGNPQPIIDITFGGTGTLDCTPLLLPILLGEFNGINQGSKNVVSWVTNSELNNDYFTVERSIDGEEWEIVGIQDGAGSSQIPLFYSMYDYKLYLPVTYYRLKQTDYNGEYTYSDIISVNADRVDGVELISELFPNPANTYATFVYNGTNSETPLTIEIVNELGTVVMSNVYPDIYKGMANVLRTSHLASGIYKVVAKQGGRPFIQRLAIIR